MSWKTSQITKRGARFRQKKIREESTEHLFKDLAKGGSNKYNQKLEF